MYLSLIVSPRNEKSGGCTAQEPCFWQSPRAKEERSGILGFLNSLSPSCLKLIDLLFGVAKLAKDLIVAAAEAFKRFVLRFVG